MKTLSTYSCTEASLGAKGHVAVLMGLHHRAPVPHFSAAKKQARNQSVEGCLVMAQEQPGGTGVLDTLCGTHLHKGV